MQTRLPSSLLPQRPNPPGSRAVGTRTVRPWLRLLTLALLLISSSVAWAQNSANYDFSTSTSGSLTLDRNGNAVDMTTGTTQLVASGLDNSSSSVTTLPFTFVFMGSPYTQFSATSNGLLGLGGTAVSSSTYAVSAGTASAPIISPFGADLRTGPAGKVHYKVVGTAPNRTLVVEFSNMTILFVAASSATNDGTYQLRLYENTGVVEFVYGSMFRNASSNGTPVSIGFAAGSTAGSLAYITSATNTNTNNSATFATQTYPASTNIANLHSTADGSRRVYTYVPPSPVAAPTAVTFSNISYNSTRVNFVDNSTNEVTFLLYRSTDNVTYTLVGSAASPSPATTGTGYFFSATGLTAGTQYYFQVVASSEGALSPPATNNVTTLTAPASMSGTYTINNTVATNATSAGGNFTSFTDAITALNAATVAGPITFNVSNSQTFSELPPAITATGTAANTITFKEATLSASLADNPVIAPTGTTGSSDAGLIVSGGDYFTFDGINVTASGSAVEFGYVVRNGSATNGAMNNVVRNAAITLNRSNTSSAGVLQSANTSYGGGVSATAATGTNQNNAYYNLQIRNAYVGVRLYSTSTTYADYNTQVYSCAIGDPATTGDIGGSSTTTYGVHAYIQSKLTLRDNTIRNVVATSGAAYGIQVDLASGTGTDASNVYNNKVGTVRVSSTSAATIAYGLAAGILTTGTQTLNIYNNFVYDVTNAYTTASATRYIRGLYLTTTGAATSTFNVFHNSVRIDGTGVPTVTSSAFEITSSSGAIVKVQNNVFANFTTGQSTTSHGKHYAWITPSTSGAIGATGSVSNNNDLYVASGTGDANRGYTGAAGSVVLTAASTVDQAALSDWRTKTSQDANSIAADPLFVSATDLHAQGSSPLDAKGATGTGISFDVDNETRDASTPDIGGDEFTPPAADVTLTSINGPTAPFTTGNYPVTITLTNVGLNALTAVDVSYALNGVVTNLGTQTLGSPLANGASTTLSLGTLAFGAGTSTLNVTLSNPNGVTDPTPAGNTLTQTFRPALCGNYNVAATGGDFTTLDAAFTALNQGGVSCPVSFTLLDATYTATTSLVINAVTGSSATNTVTIKPGSGVTSTITGSVATGAVLKLNGADYVIIDGSNNGTTSRDLTITNTSATGSGNAVVWIAAASAADGATGNVVKNTIITGNSAAGFPQFTVFVGGGGSGVTSPTTSTPAPNSNNTLQNNVITKGYYGVFVYGVSASNLDQNNLIQGNQIGQSGSANGFGAEAVRAVNQQGLTVQQNEIQSVISAAGLSHFGLNLGTLKGSLITRNSIHDVQSNSTTSGYVAYGIALASTAFNTAANPSGNTISNNFIYNLSAPLASTGSNPNVLGIANNGGYGDRVVFNTILLNGAQTAGAGYSAAVSNGDAQFITASSALDFRNNIIAITANVSTAAKYFGFYTSASSVSGSTLDNNDYYLAGSGSATFAVGNLNGTSLASSATLADWRTATSQEANSINVQPPFVSATDLHLDNTQTTATAFDAKATPISGVTVDYDGQPRNATTPDIGADEFSLPTQDLGISALTAPAPSNCYGGSQPVTVTISNYGGTTAVQPVPVTVVVTSPSNTTQTISGVYSGGSIAPGGTASFTVGNYTVSGSGNYLFDARTGYTPDSNPGNDALTTQTVAVTVPDAITVAASPTGTVCAGTTVTLTASSATGYTYTWSSPAGGNLQTTSGASVTATPSQTTTYTVTGTSGSCSIQQTITIDVNPVPTVNVTPATSTVCAGSTQTLTASATAATATIGVGTATTSASGFSVSPYGLYYQGGRFQYLLLASELTAAGFQTGDNLNNLAFNVASPNTSSPTAYTSFTIRLANTTATALTTTFVNTGLTQVVAPSSYTPVAGWNTHTFSAPYAWTGGNLLVDVSFRNSSFSDNSTVYYSTVAFNGTAYYQDDDNTSPSTQTTATNVSTNRPNIRFSRTPTYSYNWTLVSGDGLPATTTTASITVTPTQNSVYRVTASAAGFVCPGTATASVTVNPRPTATASASPTAVNPGSASTVSLALTGTGPWTFTYTTNGANPTTVTATSTNPYTFSTGALAVNTTYAVTALSDATCTATSADLANASTTVTVNAPPVDVAVASLVSPTSGICPGPNQSVTVRILNNGTQPLDFSVNPVTVSANITGPNPQTYSTTLTTGTLAVNATQDVTLTTAFDLSAGGTYTYALQASTSPQDSNPGNDTKTETRTVTLPAAVTVTPPSSTICIGNSQTLTASATQASTVILPTATFDSGADGFTVTTGSSNTTGGAFTRTAAPYTASSGPGSYNGPSGSSTGSFYIADSNVSGRTSNTQLVSPAFSTIGYPSATLTFQQYYSNYSSDVTVAVEYSLDGTTWTQLVSYKGTSQGTSSGAQTPTLVNLPAAALGQPTVQVRFNYVSTYGYYWAIDNVGVNYTPATTYAWTLVSGDGLPATTTTASITVTPTQNSVYRVTATNAVTGCSSTTTASVTPTSETVWTGAVSTSWTNSGNWTACVPSATISARIPAGTSRYPSLTTLTAGYDTRNLTIEAGATLTQSASNLRIWGDLTNNGTATLTGGTVLFRGATAQTITGAVSFNNLTVDKSADTLRVTANQAIAGNLTMTSGIVKTYSPAAAYQLALTGTLTETATSFVLGDITKSATLGTDGASSTFGGIGLTLTARSTGGASLPGATTVTRMTGRPMYGMSSSTSIRRQFNIQPAIDQNLNVDMVFGYGDSAFELQGISEGSLTLFSNAGVPGGWKQEGYTSRDATANTVTLTGLNHLSLWTLGSEAVPLPVSLTRFEATRQGKDALLTWTTAQEKDNRGFEVEVSMDGRTFRSLGFVASESPNSTTARHYRFVDAEAGKQGLRYYRLRQIDQDGKQAFFGPRTVQFEQVTKLAAVAFPNPFAGQALTLEVNAPASAATELVLLDAVGRTVLRQMVNLQAGVQRLPLQLTREPLPAGAYLLRLTSAGQTSTLRVVKQ